ncbi:hypothetical protein M409DRAFT_21011 [Zasmidium cellare ATCC 36951]|uniref:Uncharacterized protein n=1 Tax=Zasmidium cellare ATCC 36951 TaxID=1080233 RepID=A0A6A6CS73_ZASCE|nr:uncharacterized protein M409DRAFT_21011 [Zasmidium cellare ATCC 36951]KAF2169000.1 hypothetical protein M409DRAFT_21011 [Zasmidium cellare ATCC 36951]
MQAFYDVIPYVYSNTAPNEIGLRESVVEVWAGARKFVHEAAEKGKWLELVERFPELGADMITGLVGDVEIGGEGYDAVSCCGVAGDDDWAVDFTDRGGWAREENDESDDDEIEYPELIEV